MALAAVFNGVTRQIVPVAKSTLGSMIRFVASVLGRDVHISDGPMLVLAPHSDDEVLGCGALIAEGARRGALIDVVIATDGALPNGDRTVRPAETAAALAILGADRTHVRFLDRRDGSLSNDVDGLADEIGAIIEHRRPSLIVSTSSWDPHPDHRALGLAVARLAEQGRLTGEYLEYAIWQWESPRLAWRWVSAGLGRSPWTVLRSTRRVRAGADRARKREALAAYRSQVEPGPDGRRVIDSQVTKRFLGRAELLRPGPATPPDGPTMPGWMIPDQP